MNIGIFIMGSIVSAMVFGALVLLMYGAVLDGRDDAGEIVPTPPEAPTRRDALHVPSVAAR